MIRAEKPPARTAEITELFAGKVFQVSDYRRTTQLVKQLHGGDPDDQLLPGVMFLDLFLRPRIRKVRECPLRIRTLSTE